MTKIFILDSFSVYWEHLLKLDELNAYHLAKIYLDKINMLLDTYASLIISPVIIKPKLIIKSKLWINLDFQKLISMTNKLLIYFIKKKDPILKEEFHINYKEYRKLLPTLMKECKQVYYNKYFDTN